MVTAILEGKLGENTAQATAEKVLVYYKLGINRMV